MKYHLNSFTNNGKNYNQNSAYNQYKTKLLHTGGHICKQLFSESNTTCFVLCMFSVYVTYLYMINHYFGYDSSNVNAGISQTKSIR